MEVMAIYKDSVYIYIYYTYYVHNMKFDLELEYEYEKHMNIYIYTYNICRHSNTIYIYTQSTLYLCIVYTNRSLNPRLLRFRITS